MSKREQWCFCRLIVFNVILNIGKDRMIFGLSDFSQRIASLFFFLFFVLFVFVNVFVCLSFFILFLIYLIHFNIASNLPFFLQRKTSFCFYSIFCRDKSVHWKTIRFGRNENFINSFGPIFQGFSFFFSIRFLFVHSNLFSLLSIYPSFHSRWEKILNKTNHL